MSHKTRGCASDLTDAQWAIIEPLIPVYEWGRPRKLDMRQVVNAILYVLKTGCQWSMLPSEYPNANSVYHHFRRWSREGVWEEINATLRESVREAAGRKANPSAASVDSQSVKTTAVGGERRGIDAYKKVKGRKRHILVDTMGNLLKVLVTAASSADGRAAITLLKALPKALRKGLRRLWADGGYRGTFVEWVNAHYKKIVVDITLRSDTQKDFEVIPFRWVVERSFAWLGHFRRLSKDVEASCLSSESMIYLASIHRLLRRLAPASA